jgi:phenylacetic acid degradation operon negative regulatory protein
VGASEALVARTAVMDEWRNFPNLDPDLPPELLPQPWPRADARKVFVEVYNGLGPLAQARFRQVLAELSPELADLARFHTTSLAG